MKSLWDLHYRFYYAAAEEAAQAQDDVAWGWTEVGLSVLNAWRP